MASTNSDRASAPQQVDDEDDHRDDQQQMNQPAGDVEYEEAAQPSDQQDDE
jgi:hypothetical protein